VFLSAPAVARTHVINELSGVDPGTKMMQYNVPIDALWAPVAGSAVLLAHPILSLFHCLPTLFNLQGLRTHIILDADWPPPTTS
jgi:hypothetical protein